MRADASVAIGTGHVMRTLTLARRLRDRGAVVAFACRRFPGDLVDRITADGFAVLDLGAGRLDPENWLGTTVDDEVASLRAAVRAAAIRPSWWIADHYGLDARWERAVAQDGGSIFAIDDLADRQHVCRALLDQNAAPVGRYDGLVPADATLFLGPKYALVRPAFAAVRERARARDGSIRRVLVFYGGIDATGETLKALEALRALDRPLHVDVVAGEATPHRAAIVSLTEGNPRFVLHEYVAEMAQMMESADLALGAAGTATWERCLVGLPAVVTSVAANQNGVLNELARCGAAISLGPAAGVRLSDIRAALNALLDDPLRVREIGLRARALCDGYASAGEEVTRAIIDRIG